MAITRIRSSVLCIQDNQLLALRYHDPHSSDFWGVPGGEIEPGESPLAAAIRETLEETGYQAELLFDPQLAVDYDFVWYNKPYHCTTHLFVLQPIAGGAHSPRPGDAHYFTDMRWFPLAQWRELFSPFPEIQSAVADILIQLQARKLVVLEQG